MQYRLISLFSSLRKACWQVFPILIGSVLVASAAAAQAIPQRLGAFQFWEAAQVSEEGGIVCYLHSSPQSAKPANVKRGDIRFFVSHWKSTNEWFQPAITIGYPYRKGAVAAIIIDDENRFEMITDGEDAWLSGEKAEALIAAMKKGVSMTIKGISSRGTNTEDVYSLLGVTRGLDRITRACRG